jgi:hypothetical protein
MTIVKGTFWRLEPVGSVDLSAGPGAVVTLPPGLAARISRQDGIVLASWDSATEEGRVHALGVVEDKKDGSAVVRWRRANFTLRPSPQGRQKWRTMPFFKFDAVVADRYRLRDHFADKFTTAADDGASTMATPAKATPLTRSPAVSVSPFAETRAQSWASPPNESGRAQAVSPSQSPQRNRVAPNGEIFADPARGTFMGNRTSPPRWLICDLHFKRNLKEPRKYTKLFFLDEAVALAAGHRPCNTCRGDRYRDFLRAVAAEFPVTGAPELDACLQASRTGHHQSFSISSLADGAFIEDGTGHFWLKWSGALHRWTASGYDLFTTPEELGIDQAVVLTPAPTLAALRNGYMPAVHHSATGRRGDKRSRPLPIAGSLSHRDGVPLVEGPIDLSGNERKGD